MYKYAYCSCNFRNKYPEFARYFVEEFEKAVCCICKESLLREQLILSNPCAHYFCASCACQLVKNWNEEGRQRPKCPLCRSVLRDHLFAKPGFFSATRLHQCSLFVWVPTSTYIYANYNQSMIDALTSRNFIKALYYSFLMGTTPSDAEKMLAPTWPQFYEDRKKQPKLHHLCSSNQFCSSICHKMWPFLLHYLLCVLRLQAERISPSLSNM